MSAVAITTPEPIQRLISSTTSYSVQGTLGEGDYGKVVKCLKEDTKEMVAVKVLKRQYYQDTEQEAAMLQYLSCVDQDKNHLLKLHEKFDCRGDTCLALEMLDISLWDLFISQGCKPQGLNTIRQIAQQLLIALNTLECLGVLHLDIKPDNIMVANRNDPQINVKLIDFGLAKRVGEVHHGTIVQPIGYRAPEIYLGQPITTAVDVWGVGCVLAFLFTGFPLFPVHCEYQNMQYLVDTLGMPDQELLDSGGYTHYFFIQEQGPHGPSWRFMTREEFERNTSIRPKMTDSAIPKLNSLADLANMYPASSTGELWDRSLFLDLLKQLLHVDWKQRITPRQALKHPFFQKTCQSTPGTLGLSNSESMSLSSDEAQKIVSSSSDEEFGFWSTRAPVLAPCAYQASPDGVEGEMGDHEEVSSSSEEEFGFWKTRDPIPTPCAYQASPDGIVREMGDREEVSSSSDEEFGFWRTRDPVPTPSAYQASPDGIVREMGDREEVSSSSDEEFGFWRTRDPISTPSAYQASPDGVEGEMGDRNLVSSSSEEEFGFWRTRDPISTPCAYHTSPDGVEGEVGDMVTKTKEPQDTSCSHLSSSVSEDTKYSTSEDNEGYEADKEDNDHEEEHSDVEDLDNREIFMRNNYVLWDMYCACQARSLGAESGLFDRLDSPVSPRESPEVSQRGLNIKPGVCSFNVSLHPRNSDKDSCSKPSEEDASPPGSLGTLGLSTNDSMSLSSDEAQEIVASSSDEEFGFWRTRDPVPTPCAYQASPDGIVREMGDRDLVSSSSDEEFGFWRTRDPISTPCAYQASPDGIVREMGDHEEVSSSSDEEFGFWRTRDPVPTPCAYQASPDGIVREMGDREEVSSSSDEEFGFWRTRDPVPTPCAYHTSPDGIVREMGDREEVSSSSEEEFGFWRTRDPVSASCAYHTSPDGVVREMGDREEVSSSSEEEFGFWRTRDPVPTPCAYHTSPDGVDGEVGDREVISSSSEEEFGFWKTGATDEGAQCFSKDGVFPARGSNQMASPAEALVTPNLRRRVMKRSRKSCQPPSAFTPVWWNSSVAVSVK